jgi:hypothetical protein
MSAHFQSPAQNLPEEESRRVAEAARESKWENPSFLKELFLGRLRWDLVYPFPSLAGSERPEFQKFYNDMKSLLDEVDSDAIDRNGKIPAEVLRKLADIGAFGMKIEKKYGGLELSQFEYSQVMKLLCSRDGNLTALLSAHQSIGVPQPLKMFGSEEQKKKYLPRIARGAVTAFALTEPDVGSDPARLATSVSESEDGKAYILNGRKLWCTNGTIAEFIIVMARHSEDGAISAFIVESGWEGVKIEHRCHFMGLKALENAQLSFINVRIPKENLIWKKGRGLKLALITLNVGRLALPASAVGSSKTCLEISRKWAAERTQWGKPIGQHEAIAHKIADMAAYTFATESVADLANLMAEKGLDIRLEAAVAKLYNTESNWKILDDTLQIRGGRGYETSDSLKNRGEPGIAVEQMFRDARINLIFEGSSEIMRLFIAREALDKHLQISGILLDGQAGFTQKLAALPKIGLFYARWYPSLWLKWGRWPRYGNFRRLAKHARFIDRATRKLAREIFHGMIWHRGKLERKQAFLFRAVDIGAELFAMAAAISRAKKVFDEGNRNAMNLAEVFCREAEKRIEGHFKALWSNSDDLKYRLARQVLDKQFAWLEEGGAGLKAEKKSPYKHQQLQPAEEKFVEEVIASILYTD